MTDRFDTQVFADALQWYFESKEYKIYFSDMSIFDFRDDLINNPKTFHKFMERYWESYHGDNPSE